MKLLILAAVLAVAAADVSHILAKADERHAQILRQELDSGVEGQYQWAIETDNGISAQAQGSLKQISQQEPAQVVQGSAQWTAPNGEVVQLSYSADENGYQAQGSHIPTPPPLPDHVVRSLAYIRDHPPPKDQQ